MILEMDSMLLMILSTALLGGSVFVLSILRNLNEWYYVGGRNTGQLPPGDMGWPIIGNLFSFLRAFKSSDPDSFISNLVSRYGRTGMYRAYLFGKPSIIVCSPETCRRVMTDDGNFKSSYPISTGVLLGRRGLHKIPDGPERKRFLRLITSPFPGHETLSMYVACMERVVIDHLCHLSSSDSPFELTTELLVATFKVITTIFMGLDSDFDSQVAWKFYPDFVAGLKSQAINIPGFAFHKALWARNKLVKILQKVLDDKRTRTKCEGEESKKDMIDLLMTVNDEEGKQLEDEDIIDILLPLLMAGHETTAYGTLWAIIYLTQNPHVLAKAKEEQEKFIKKRPSTQEGLTLKEIKQMSYLSKVIDETLRRTTVSFLNFREAKVDVHVNGYTIPKGWRVLIWNRGVHMDPQTYPNPKKFKPERWENNKPKPGSFLAFGFGSRLCPGADLAKLEILIFLHHFLLNYRVELLNPTAPISFLPMPRPSDKCQARVIKINP